MKSKLFLTVLLLAANDTEIKRKAKQRFLGSLAFPRMKNMSLKTSLIVALCVIMISFNGCKKKPVERRVTYRPDNFPEIIVPPENAIDVSYANPKFYKRTNPAYYGNGGPYSFSYHMVEEYPATETIEQIRNDLKMKGCIKVEDWGGWSKDRSKTLPDTRWRIGHYWMEIWITPSDDLVDNSLLYKYTEGKKEMNKLLVTRSVDTASSRTGRDRLRSYKETHPELFEDNPDEKTISDDGIK